MQSISHINWHYNRQCYDVSLSAAFNVKRISVNIQLLKTSEKFWLSARKNMCIVFLHKTYFLNAFVLFKIMYEFHDIFTHNSQSYNLLPRFNIPCLQTSIVVKKPLTAFYSSHFYYTSLLCRTRDLRQTPTCPYWTLKFC